MPRYIDADALKSALENNPSDFYDYDELIPLIDAQPTVSPDEVRGVGTWLSDEEDAALGMEGHCSKCCCCTPNIRFKYCPNCGAKMEVSE